MKTEIENLFNNGETIILNLRNMHYHIRKYREEVKKLRGTYPGQANSEEMKSFRKIFRFYDKHLIPALKESIAMEQKHIGLIMKNPDPKFKPLEEEAKSHQAIIIRFKNRFEEIHEEFYTYTQRLKKNN